MKKLLVGVVMGGNSDWKVMQYAVGILRLATTPSKARTEVMDLHRTLARRPAKRI